MNLHLQGFSFDDFVGLDSGLKIYREIFLKKIQNFVVFWSEKSFRARFLIDFSLELGSFLLSRLSKVVMSMRSSFLRLVKALKVIHNWNFLKLKFLILNSGINCTQFWLKVNEKVKISLMNCHMDRLSFSKHFHLLSEWLNVVLRRP